MKPGLSRFPLRPVTVTLILAAIVAVPLIAQSQKEESGKPDPEKKTASEDPFAIPDGKPAELVKYIEAMQAKAQQVPTIAEFKKYQGAILKAAEKVLAAKTDEKTEVAAIQAKFMALSFLGRFGDAKAAGQLLTFAKGLTKHKNKEVAEVAETQVLMSRVQTVTGMKPAEQKALVEDVMTFLKSGELKQRLGVAMAAVQGLEQTENNQLAADMYNRLAKLLAKSTDERLKNHALKMEGSARRVMLVGNTIDIKGTTVDGKPFNWGEYKGKVVLIDFWATWCGPCIAELPNVKLAYKKYHSKGFEVVGISLDEDKDALEGFIKGRKIEWTNLFGNDPKATGWEHPMATYYGIMGIPSVILVDQKGKVVSLSARGLELHTQLKNLLGPVDDAPEKKDEKKDEKPKK